MTSGQKVVDDRFELVDRLGSGGMGTVWRARDLALHREVALKEVRPAGADPVRDDPKLARMMRERVMREARALARIDHPNVVRIHHIVDEPDMDYPWLVMELVRGGSLSGRLAERDLSPAEAAVLGRGVLGALRAVHEAGICHRDVKPANVLLRTDGSPVLTDFGIAALDDVSRLTATGGLAGSPEYIAPERLHGKEGDPASDFWSLGMLLYVAVEGHNPMRRPTTAATLAAVLRADVPPPVQAGPLAGVLQALLVADPAARPGAEQLDHMLAQAAYGQGSAASSAGGLAAAAPAAGPAAGPVAGPAVGEAPPSTPEPFAPPTPEPFGSLTPPAPPAHPNAPQYPYPAGPGFGGPPAGGPTGPGLGHQPTGPGFGAPGQTGPGFGGPGHGSRPSRRSSALVIALPIGAATVVGVLLVAMVVLIPKVLDGARQGGAGNEGGSLTGRTGDPTASAGATRAPGKVDLLTPAAIRQVIAAFEKAAGTTRFASLKVYPEYAYADVPVRGVKNGFDQYEYRDGRAARDRPSIAVDEDDGLVDLKTFNWNAVPALFKACGRLGVHKPTSRYILVEPAWTFYNKKPVMMFYLSGEYNSAYLAANQKGTVVHRNKAS
ncbi:serine/threonine-protein kinase [Spirillospora sp. NPDC047279]|uniref:serine/threonine-protein kinase n=1 Tax=Spirillospora sp. NPDC047279 TaxID=3155478 RepID=UPI0033CFE12C